MIDLATLAAGTAIGAAAMSALAERFRSAMVRANRRRQEVASELARTETDLREMVAAFNKEMRAQNAAKAGHLFACGRIVIVAKERDDALAELAAVRPLAEKGRALVARRRAQDAARRVARAAGK